MPFSCEDSVAAEPVPAFASPEALPVQAPAKIATIAKPKAHRELRLIEIPLRETTVGAVRVLGIVFLVIRRNPGSP